MIRTSHVGSFPLSYSEDNIRRVLRDLKRIGLDVPTYPQLRSFIDIYLKPLESLGIVYSRRGIYFSSKKNFEKAPPEVVIEDAEKTIEIVRSEGLSFKWLRGPVTGAFTLSSRIYLSEDVSKGLQSTVLADKDIVKDFFTIFVGNMVNRLSSLGYNIVFVDEPALTFIVGRRILYGWTEEEIIEVLSKVSKSATTSEVGIHICGHLNPKILEIVSRVDKIKYLSLEFFATPSNIDLIDKSLLDKYDKIVSPGIVAASKPSVESVDEAYTTLLKVYERSGGRVDLVSGDCGFGGLRGSLGDEEKEYAISIDKLKTVVEAVRRLESRTRL
ncbi:MAG: methionine synthase [Ignisphaera sp.]